MKVSLFVQIPTAEGLPSRVGMHPEKQHVYLRRAPVVGDHLMIIDGTRSALYTVERTLLWNNGSVHVLVKEVLV